MGYYPTLILAKSTIIGVASLSLYTLCRCYQFLLHYPLRKNIGLNNPILHPLNHLDKTTVN